jgi:hypothetical protein
MRGGCKKRPPVEYISPEETLQDMQRREDRQVEKLQREAQ